MFALIKSCLFIVLVSFLTSCSQTTKKSPKNSVVQNSKEKSSWEHKMKLFAQKISKIYPTLVNDKLYHSPELKREVIQETKDLKKIAKSLENQLSEKLTRLTRKNPGFMSTAQSFVSEIGLAETAFERNRDDYGRSLMKKATSYCIECHSQGAYSRHFSFTESSDFKLLDEYSKAELYFALHNYKESARYYLSYIKSQDKVIKNPFLWEKALKAFIKVSTQNLKDFEGAVKGVEGVLNSSLTPLFLKSDAKTWLNDLKAWHQARKQGLFKKSQSIELAKKMMDQAQGRSNRKGDRPSFVLYLRASLFLHKWLLSEDKGRSSKQLAQVQRMLGECYEVLDDDLGYLSESYYRSCILTSPGSVLAQDCFKRFERNIYFGYSGSRGFDLPQSVSDYLGRLKQKAYNKTTHE